MDNVICQLDWATLHCSNASLKYLHRYFHWDRLISRRTDHPWPAHSPDRLDDFLWGYLKDRSMLTSPKLVMRSRITFEQRSGKFPVRFWTGSLQTSVYESPHWFSAKELGSSTL